MKKLLFILLFFVSVSTFSQGNFFWSHRYGLPTIFTLQPSGIGTTYATGGAIVQDVQGCPILTIGIIAIPGAYGVPTLANFTNAVYTYRQSYYTGQFTGLSQSTWYLYRAFIYTGYETIYGDIKQFTTSQAPPTTYHNEIRNYTFYASNCVERFGAGYFPNAYTYQVVHGQCNELTQALADACADAIAAANGQAAADASGTCSMEDTYSNLGRDSTVRHTGCYFSCVGTLVTYSVAANTYVNQLTQAEADALELSDLVSQIATNQGTCERPTGLTQGVYFGSGGGWIDAYNTKYDWCDVGTLPWSNTCQYTNLNVGGLVYNGVGTSCYPVADGWYYFNNDCNTTPENTLYYEITSGAITQIESGPQ